MTRQAWGPRQPIAKSSGSIRAKVNLIKRIETAVLTVVILASVRSQQTTSQAFRSTLGSGLIDHIQKMTMAAIAMADMKVCAHRSYRVWMRRQSFSLPNMFSILWRFR